MSKHGLVAYGLRLHAEGRVSGWGKLRTSTKVAQAQQGLPTEIAPAFLPGGNHEKPFAK